jgi:hypothetical protein
MKNLVSKVAEEGEEFKGYVSQGYVSLPSVALIDAWLKLTEFSMALHQRGAQA